MEGIYVDEQAFSAKEDKEILEFIATRKLENVVGGSSLWWLMEKDGVCGGKRTAGSLKKRYFDKLLRRNESSLNEETSDDARQGGSSILPVDSMSITGEFKSSNEFPMTSSPISRACKSLSPEVSSFLDSVQAQASEGAEKPSQVEKLKPCYASSRSSS